MEQEFIRNVDARNNMLDTHNKHITFGKHKGVRWTRLSVNYLRWIANESTDHAKQMAESELERRGSVMPCDIELSGHSIDRASEITDVWKGTGVYSWLNEIAGIASTLTKKSNGNEKISYSGFKFVFKHGNHYPILITIMMDDDPKKAEKNNNLIK